MLRPRQHALRLTLAMLWAGLLVGCEEPAHRPDVLVITLDTARADHFSYAGDSPVATPSIDRLAAEGTSFLTAVTPAPITLPAHASLFTGLLPVSHGVRNNGTYRLSGGFVTLAELMSDEDYDTAAFVAAAVLDQRHGLDQGFDRYDDEVGEQGTAGLFQYPRRRGESVVKDALGWLDGVPRGVPTFLWVHLFDPHAPYDPPEPERSRFPGSPYAASIAYSDRVVGRLLAGYRKRGRYDGALIVLTADHGEGLGEHQEDTHGVLLYDTTVRVPLVVRGPAVPAGLRIRQQVQLVDLFPTLVTLLGLQAEHEVDGRDLAPLLADRALDGSARPARIESLLPREDYGWSEMSGIRTDRWKLVTGARTLLYDLGSDPRENTDVATAHPDRVRELMAAMNASSTPAGVEQPTRLDPDDSVRAQLGALGYLSLGREDREATRTTDAPDPMERIGLLNRMSEAAILFARGEQEPAIGIYRQLSEEEPGNYLVQGQLGNMLASSGSYEEALRVYGRAAELSPRNPRVQQNRAHCLERLGRMDEALAAYDQVLAIDPGYSSARTRRWNLLRQVGRWKQVAGEAEEALKTDAGDVRAHLALTLALEVGGDLPASDQALALGLDLHPGDLGLKTAHAQAKIRHGEIDDGIQLLREVLDQRPTHVAAATGLGHLLLARNEVAAAREVLESAVQTALPAPDLLTLLAEACARQGDVALARGLAERAASSMPLSARAWSTLGSVLLLANRPGPAADAYQRALAIDPDDRNAALNLAAVYEDLGRLSEADRLRERFR